MTGNHNNKMQNMMTETLLFENKKIKTKMVYDINAEEAKKQSFHLDLPQLILKQQSTDEITPRGQTTPNTASMQTTETKQIRLPKITLIEKSKKSESLASKPST